MVAKRTLGTAQWSDKPRVPAPLTEGGKDGDEDKEYTIHIQYKYNTNTK